MRNDDDAVLVAHHPVTRFDLHPADGDGHLGRRHLPAPGRVLGRREAGEHGEARVDDEAHVAAAAVDHATRDATREERRRGQLAEVRRDVVVALVDGHVTRRDAPEHGQRLADRRIPVLCVGRPALDGERLPGETHPRCERRDLGRERLPAEAVLVQHVGQRGRVDARESLPHGFAYAGVGIARSAGVSSPRPSTSSGARSRSSRSTSSARRTRSRPSRTARSSRWRPAG